MALVDMERTAVPAGGIRTLNRGARGRLRSAARDSSAARWGLATVLLLMAYEWLLSGLDKILSGGFAGGLAPNLRAALKDNPNRWYVHFVTRVIVPNAHATAVLIEAGEILVALGLIAGAAWWLIGARLPASWALALRLGGVGALIGSALMTANYYLLAGNTLPWLNTVNPFNEGLSIDGLLTLVALALVVVHLFARGEIGDSR